MSELYRVYPDRRAANAEENFTREQLTSALAELNFWLKPESQPGHALRGKLLHHEDAANDIIMWMRRH